MKKLRGGFLLWAVFSLTISNIAGCASSGQQAGSTDYDFTEFPLEPTAESLVRLPEGSEVQVELKTGEIITGAFLTLSAGATALDLRVNEGSKLLAPEFIEEDLLYRVPLDSIKTLATVDSEAESRPNGVLLGLGLIVVAFFTAAALGAFQLGDDY